MASPCPSAFPLAGYDIKDSDIVPSGEYWVAGARVGACQIAGIQDFDAHNINQYFPQDIAKKVFCFDEKGGISADLSRATAAPRPEDVQLYCSTDSSTNPCGPCTPSTATEDCGGPDLCTSSLPPGCSTCNSVAPKNKCEPCIGAGEACGGQYYCQPRVDPMCKKAPADESKACMSFGTSQCKFDRDEIRAIQFKASMSGCYFADNAADNTWAAPLWMVPTLWKGEKQGMTGEIDFIERCGSPEKSGDSGWFTNFGDPVESAPIATSNGTLADVHTYYVEFSGNPTRLNAKKCGCKNDVPGPCISVDGSEQCAPGVGDSCPQNYESCKNQDPDLPDYVRVWICPENADPISGDNPAAAACERIVESKGYYKRVSDLYIPTGKSAMSDTGDMAGRKEMQLVTDIWKWPDASAGTCKSGSNNDCSYGVTDIKLRFDAETALSADWHSGGKCAGLLYKDCVP